MRTRTRPSDGNATVLCQARRSASWSRSTALVSGNHLRCRTERKFFLRAQGDWPISKSRDGNNGHPTRRNTEEVPGNGQA